MPYADQQRQREWARTWKAARRAAAMAGACCAVCGATGSLELDHIDPSTKVDHRIWTWSKARIAAELAKCQWLCKPCHIAKTLAENGLAPSPHGSYRRYRVGCRCSACRAANRDSKRRSRARRAARLKERVAT